MDAFRTEIKNNGVKSLYEGAPPYLITSITLISTQFMMYEAFMKHFKKEFGQEKFKANERKLTIIGSLMAGCISAVITNPLECITVNKQT